MTKKSIAAAVLALFVAPCVAFCACGGDAPSDGSGGGDAKELTAQVQGTKDTYGNIYARAERNGGLFAEKSVAASATSDRFAAYADEPSEEELNTDDVIAALLASVREADRFAGLPSRTAAETYVLDVFAYTQIASSIVTAEGESAFTKIYDVDYTMDDEFDTKMRTSTGWVSNIPEEMSLAGYDEQSGKVNILFKARSVADKKVGREVFESVNSEMYYRSDDDFGYAQITSRYNSAGDLNEIGFNYFSMKDREMLELNFDANGNFTRGFGAASQIFLSAAKREEVKDYMTVLTAAFGTRTAALEQRNLACAAEAELIEKAEEGASYTKSRAQTP